MSFTAIFGKTVLVAVFLFGIGCSGDEDFEPAPGATVEVSELEALITAAVDGFGFEAIGFQTLQTDDSAGGRESCFVVESGPCFIPRPPGLSASFHGEDGTGAVVNVLLAIDNVEASDLVNNAVVSRRATSSEALRVLFESARVPDSRTIGPCDADAAPDADDGCAWDDRGAPGVGDEARAMSSETLETKGFSMVAFTRGSVFASVEVVGPGEAPNEMANDLAKSLDNEIKAALSQ